MVGEERVKDKILFVHEDRRFCDFISNTLYHLGFETELAGSSEEAQQKILNNIYKVVICDKTLVDGNAFDILNFFRKVSLAPFLMILPAIDDKENEGQDVLNFSTLARPFREKELLEAFEKLFKAQENNNINLNGAEFVKTEEEFSAVNIDEFISGKEIKFDIFISIGPQKFVKLSRGNEFLDENQIEKLKQRGVTSLYMRRSDFLSYINMTVNLVKRMGKLNLSANRKSEFIQQTTKMLSNSILLKEIDGEAISHAKAIVDATLAMMVGCDEILMTLEFFKNSHKDAFAHSVNVSMYSVLIARNLKWNSYSTLSKLAAGGMFHDIGKLKVPKALEDIPSRELGPVENMIIESHVEAGVVFLKAIPSMPEEIVKIVEQHHEDEAGKGFPQGIKRNRIHPLAKIVKVADEFCELMGKRNPSMNNIIDVIRILENEKGRRYHEDSVMALKACFKRRMSKTA